MNDAVTTPLRPLVRSKADEKASCHGGPQADTTGLPLVAIVGSPNVGKSVLFNTLTGMYVTVSNYPGTTVEVSRGRGQCDDSQVGVVDTPGMYRLLPITEEERVARKILLAEQPQAVVHVLDAKNLERMLPMTLQLIEAGLPVVLVANLMDEAERLGVQIDFAVLGQALGVPVVPTALALGRGAPQLKLALADHLRRKPCACAVPAERATIQYHPQIESALAGIERLMQGSYQLSKRTVALLLLEDDTEVAGLVQGIEGTAVYAEIHKIVGATQARSGQPLSYIISRNQRTAARKILDVVFRAPERRVSGFAERLSAAMMRPLTGLPLLALALYGLYQFVGVLGAQTLVKFLEDGIFGAYVNPWVDAALAAVVPWQVLRDLIGGEYGIITLGVRYAIGLVLPIVGTFFIAFSVIEDSGYLPRLAMLIDRVFKRIGLNGRAVIPMVLGFGCDTMATITTRTLETKRERILSTLLLSLAIPCSAQLGLMLGLLTQRPLALAIWVLVVTGIFMLVGLLAAKLMPGERPTFYMELPPLRLPTLRNVFVKTYTRMEWYLREVMPMFILASVFIWLGRLTGLFDVVVSGLVPLMHWLGLPDELAVTFLFGFFRRDYGAAGLFDMGSMLTGLQIVVAITTLTLFVPCVAQFSVTLKERGWKVALAMTAFIFPFAFLVGGLLYRLLAFLRLPL